MKKSKKPVEITFSNSPFISFAGNYWKCSTPFKISLRESFLNRMQELIKEMEGEGNET